MKRVYYTIEKSTLENKWILWRNTEGKNSCGSYRVYTGDTKVEVERFKRRAIGSHLHCKLDDIEVVRLNLVDMMRKNKRLEQEIDRLNNIINELQWKPIDEYFKNKEKYDWVLVKYYDKYNFKCIPSVAEYRFDKWHLKDNEKSLQDYEVRYFFDMQQLDKLKELKEVIKSDRV